MLQDIFDYTNPGKATTQVVVEPFARTYQAAPGETLHFVAFASQPGVFEVEREGDATVLYLSQDAVCEVYRGNELVDTCENTSPNLATPAASGSILRIVTES